MKRCVIVLAVFAALLLPSATVARAQDGGDQPAPEGGARPEGDGGDAPRGQGRQGRRGGRRGGFGGGGFDPTAQLTEELGLSEEQAAQIRELTGELREQSRESFRQMREEGLDREQMRERFEEQRKKQDEAIRSVLTDEQKEKYDGLLAEREARRAERGQRGRGGRGGEGGEGGFGGGRGGRGGDPAQRRERRLEQIKEALILSEDEQAVIMPLIEKILTAQESLRTTTRDQQREFEEFLKSGPEADAITARLGDLRTARDTIEKDLDGARKELVELVTLEQEAKLYAFGVLR